MEDYIKNNYEVYDRFTFDSIFRFLLSNGYQKEEAKDVILYNCALSALVLQERIYNRYYYRISVNEEISKDLIEFMNEVAEKIMTLKGKEFERFYDYLNNKRINLSDNFQNDKKLVPEDKSFDNINNLYNSSTHTENVGAIKTIYGQLEKILNVKIQPAHDEWDRLYNVDFFIKIGDNYIGLQIKPASAVSHIPQIFKEHSIQGVTHTKFTEEYGGKVFYIISIKEGGKKKIHNTEVIPEIEQEIMRLKDMIHRIA